MKKLFVIMITGIIILTFSACNQQSSGANIKITAEEALNIALEQAGVTKDSITNLENTLDSENGVYVYEIDFDSGNVEYSYDINAQTGAIVERDRDIVD